MGDIQEYDNGVTFYPIGTIISSGGCYYRVVDDNTPNRISCTTNRGDRQHFVRIEKPQKTARGNQMIELLGGL